MAKKKITAIPISPQMFMSQWVHAAHKFQLNIWNFEVQAGKMAVEVFQKSFDLRRLNTNDVRKMWPKRKRTYKHPILQETGTLRNSIEWKFLNNSPGPKKGGVRIFTNPAKFGTAARHKGFCYAAIHNEGVGVMPQRQFIGDSSIIRRKMKELVAKIFNGLPR